MRLAAVLVACALLSCGRLRFDTRGDGGGDGLGDDASLDSADAAPLGPFAPPVRVDIVSENATDDLGPTVDITELELHFLSPRVGGYTLWSATRPAKDQPWNAAQRVTATDVTGPIEYDPEVSIGGTELFYGTNNAPNGIRTVTRIQGQPWPGPGTTITDGLDRNGPSLFLDDTRMLVGNAAATGAIHELARSGVMQPWMFVRTHGPLGELTSPAVSQDGLEMFAVHATTFQLFRATRNTIDEAFGFPTRYLFGSALDGLLLGDPELTHDGRTMYICADATGNDYDIYVTTR